jgi:hypothetical protein
MWLRQCYNLLLTLKQLVCFIIDLFILSRNDTSLFIQYLRCFVDLLLNPHHAISYITILLIVGYDLGLQLNELSLWWAYLNTNVLIATFCRVYFCFYISKFFFEAFVLLLLILQTLKLSLCKYKGLLDLFLLTFKNRLMMLNLFKRLVAFTNFLIERVKLFFSFLNLLNKSLFFVLQFIVFFLKLCY